MLTHKATQKLETQRLILRRAMPEDTQPMYKNWASDPEVTKFLTWPAHSSLNITEMIINGWIRAYNSDDFYQWMIVPRDINQPIGSISVVSGDDQVGKAEIGYCIGKAWWHQGIMSEALQAVIDFLFDEVGMNRIEAKHDPNNPHSGGVMRKCGMKYEGTFRQSSRNNQGVCDTACYSILRSEHSGKQHFMEGFVPEDDTALVQEIYSRFDEAARLTKSKAAQVEFLTTVRYIERHLKPGDHILDIGAGAGIYSLYLARKGFRVSSLELADSNIAAFRAELTADLPIDLVQGNALDLSRYADNSFDIVLVLGPLYHLHSDADKLQCIAEAKRVCKPGGKIFFAFITNDIVILTMQQAHPDYLLKGDYHKETFQLEDFPFVFHTLPRCRELLTKGGIHICNEIASDGVSELLSDRINGMDEATYQQFLRYHFYTCEKPEHLGMSNHLLFIGEADG